MVATAWTANRQLDMDVPEGGTGGSLDPAMLVDAQLAY
jgi:hypothetical protein